MASTYAHPIEYFIGNITPTVLGGSLMRGHIHASTHVFFSAYMMIKTTQAHSGYNFPCYPFRTILFGGSSIFHDHHHLVNIGNYGGDYIFWDAIFQTDCDYVNDLEKQQRQNSSKRIIISKKGE